VRGSIEFAVTNLGSILVFVMGHSECGAVRGAIDQVTRGVQLPGDIAAVVEPIVPAVEAVRGTGGGELTAAAVRENVRRTISVLCDDEAVGH
jgi:carbonic anhydrase